MLGLEWGVCNYQLPNFKIQSSNSSLQTPIFKLQSSKLKLYNETPNGSKGELMMFIRSLTKRLDKVF